MTAQTSEAILIPEDVLAVLQALSPERRQQVFDFAEFLGQKQEQADQSKPDSFPPRVLGLHAGQGWTSDDFDEPLPDDFWFSETDPLMMSDEQIKQLNNRSAML
jgi:Protein of unknown function (DUF2281)